MHLPAASARPLVSFDPEGQVFAGASCSLLNVHILMQAAAVLCECELNGQLAVSMNSELIKLFDIRSFEKGPFLTFRIGRESSPSVPPEWASVRFSPDGRFIAIASTPQHLSQQPAAPPDYSSLSIRIIDAFNGI